MAGRLYRWWDGRVEKNFDRDDFEMACVLLGENSTLADVKTVAAEFIKIGYQEFEARELVIMARAYPLAANE